MKNKTYQLNRKIARKSNDIITPEGSRLYAEDISKSLFLNASAFKLRNSFYWSAQDVMDALESLLDAETDYAYKLSMARFLADALGIRLSPVIITSREALRTDRKTLQEKWLLARAVEEIYDRPDKITNALAYSEYATGSAKMFPAYFRKALKSAFENFSPYTLKKFKMKRRRVKTADVIKLLHPKPRTDKLSRLYKAIIENSNEASIEKGTVITEVLSDKTKTQKDKTDWIKNNLTNLPINALIRNLRSLDDTVETLDNLERKLSSGLRSVNGIPVVKVVNPFDVLTAGINCGNTNIMNVIDRVLGDFIYNNNLGLSGLNISFVVDISGSMSMGGINIAGDYMALLLPMLQNNTIRLYAFNTRVHDRTNRLPTYRLNFRSPITLRTLFMSDFRANGGTSLADAVREVSRSDRPDLMIVISDEVSWADRHGYSRLPSVDTSILAINPYPQGKFTAYNPKEPKVIKVSSLDAKVLYYIPIMADFNKFKNWLKEYYR